MSTTPQKTKLEHTKKLEALKKKHPYKKENLYPIYNMVANKLGWEILS